MVFPYVSQTGIFWSALKYIKMGLNYAPNAFIFLRTAVIKLSNQNIPKQIDRALDDHEFFYSFTIMIWAQKCDHIAFRSHLKKKY